MSQINVVVVQNLYYMSRGAIRHRNMMRLVYVIGANGSKTLILRQENSEVHTPLTFPVPMVVMPDIESTPSQFKELRSIPTQTMRA